MKNCMVYRLAGRAAVFSILMVVAATASAQTTRSSLGLDSSSPTATLDAAKEMRVLASDDIRQSFPRLQLKYVEVLGPSTRQYNCIAHSLGANHWVNPKTGDNEHPLAPMDKTYAHEGYVRDSGLNYAVEPGKEKVVLYAALNPDGTIRNVTHAARQETDGTWTSKLGALSLIRHVTPDALRGPAYGTPVAVYVRPTSANPHHPL